MPLRALLGCSILTMLALSCSSSDDTTSAAGGSSGAGEGDANAGAANAGTAGSNAGGSSAGGAGGASQGTAGAGAADKPGYELTFVDEFDGAALDTTKWRVHDWHDKYWPDMPNRRNYKASNVYLEDGALVIRTIKESDGVYSTGSVDTRRDDAAVGPHRFAQAFGLYEARFKFGKEPGHWSAFWLFDDIVNTVDGSGRDGTEIDIMEKAHLDDRVAHALHWDGYGPEHRSASKVVTGRSVNDGNWHTVALEWSESEYVFFVDGVESWRTTAGGVCQQPLYLWLSEEITDDTGRPDWGTAPTSTANLPDYFRIDYVRVYRKLQ